MARDTLGYQYTGDRDSSRMPGGDVERMGKIFKDMPPYTPCPTLEYSTSHQPNNVSSHDFCL
jgi:hypothetical protein